MTTQAVPRILVVEDDARISKALGSLLEEKGYITYAARSVDEARHFCATEIIHVAVVDVSLTSDSGNKFGLEFIERHLPGGIPAIVKSDQQLASADIQQLVNRIPRNCSCWFPSVSNDLAAKIKEALSGVHINFNLHIEKPNACVKVVEEVRHWQDLEGAERMMAADVVRDLFQQMFYRYESIRVVSTTPGHGPCTVAKIVATKDGVPGLPVAVKIGPTDSIFREASNYRDFVEPNLAHAPQWLGDAVFCRDMGAIEYRFAVGDTLRELWPDIALDKLRSTLRELFGVACKQWYEHKRMVPHNPGADGRIGASPDDVLATPLDTFYRRHLNLTDARHVDSLNANVQRLLDSALLTRTNDRFISLRLDRAATVALPDPLNAVFKDFDSESGSNFFGMPTYVSITHGDLHGGNLLRNSKGDVRLIDFYKTGWAPSFLDFVELESDIKFELGEFASLHEQWVFENALAGAKTLRETSTAALDLSPGAARALEAIGYIRGFAAQLAGDDMREYQTGLLFFAIRRIIGYVSSPKPEGDAEQSRKIHAVMSAGLICQRLLMAQPGTRGSVFVGHDYNDESGVLVHGKLRNIIESEQFAFVHPTNPQSAGEMIAPTLTSIRNASVAIFDLTTLNANVLFEVGYALGALVPVGPMGHESKLPANVPSVLRTLRWILYPTAFEANIREVINTHGRGRDWFWRKPNFKAQSKVVSVQQGSAILAIANHTSLQKDLKDSLMEVCKEESFQQVEPLDIANVQDFGQLYFTIAKSEMVIGCLGPSSNARDLPANSDVSMALGMALAMEKPVLILHQEPCNKLSDMIEWTREFTAVYEAERILRAFIREKFKVSMSRAN